MSWFALRSEEPLIPPSKKTSMIYLQLTPGPPASVVGAILVVLSRAPRFPTPCTCSS